MHAWEIMSKPVVRVLPSTTVREAAASLVEHGFAGMPVVDDGERVIGMFTEADALRATTAGGNGATVAEYMSTPVEVASMATEIEGIARRMLADRLRCVPITEEGVLVGVVSRRDLLRPLVSSDDTVATVLAAVLTDYSGHRGEWRVEVSDGEAVISGEFVDEAERRVVGALARSVRGVTGVTLKSVPRL
ncbi:CBS domain-containing protein [Amycolatopsis thermoflava]|uniref:CBS domain-containing protein n=1 Tax=Amycolatopsis thermoflava TaxID=84480 RepID=UPI003667D76A